MLNKRQLLALFLCSLVPWTIGNGMMPLLPVYAAGLGATPAVAGYYLSLSYGALTVGTVSAGWLSARSRRAKIPIITAGLVSIPALYLMGQVTKLWCLAVVSAIWFFCAGMVVALASIAAGLGAEGSERGKVFGLLGLTAELGAVIGGPVSGLIADGWGYPIMFAILSLLGILGPLAGLLLKEQAIEPAQCRGAASTPKKAGLGKSFYLLFLASLAAAAASFVFTLGRSFVMADLGFGAAALSSTGAIGGVVALPFPLLAGWLSDRLGREKFLALSFLAGMGGLLALIASTCLWHFWAASLLFTLSFVGGAVGSALVTDLVAPDSLGRGLSLFSATTWVGGIIGCAVTGCAAQSLGTTSTLIAGVLLSVLAVTLLVPVGRSRQMEAGSAGHLGKVAAGQPLRAKA